MNVHPGSSSLSTTDNHLQIIPGQMLPLIKLRLEKVDRVCWLVLASAKHARDWLTANQASWNSLTMLSPWSWEIFWNKKELSGEGYTVRTEVREGWSGHEHNTLANKLPVFSFSTVSSFFQTWTEVWTCKCPSRLFQIFSRTLSLLGTPSKTSNWAHVRIQQENIPASNCWCFSHSTDACWAKKAK